MNDRITVEHDGTSNPAALRFTSDEGSGHYVIGNVDSLQMLAARSNALVDVAEALRTQDLTGQPAAQTALAQIEDAMRVGCDPATPAL